jgi:membrane-associated phospholipid phosphatase
MNGSPKAEDAGPDERVSVKKRAAEWPPRPPSPASVSPTATSETEFAGAPGQPSPPCTPAPEVPVPRGSHVSLSFPEALESALSPLDDALIPRAQRLWATVELRYAFLATTTMTAIEAALPVPGALYALGYDAAGGLCTSILIVLALASQIPKKFIWRQRPWMAGRAKAHRRDSTSSFPSRAVVCGVVFAWLALASVAVETSGAEAMPVNLVWLAVVFSASAASLSRVVVGAHYPSDCVCGFLLGVLILKLGGKLELAWLRAGCAALASSAPSGAGTPASALSLSAKFHFLHLPAAPRAVPEPRAAGKDGAELITVALSSLSVMRANMPVVRLLACVTLSYVVTMASIAGFWVKCSYVYGLLLSTATFRYVFLASAATGVSVPGVLDHGTLGRHVKLFSVYAAILAFGMATRGRKGAFRIAAFTLIYFGTLGSLMWFRVR